MINREIIRNKIVQLTYAYYLNGNKNIDTAEKELFFSLSKAYDLYNHLLSLIVAVTKEAQRRLEVTQGRAKREGTPEPSQKFAYNRFAIQLQENKALNEFIGNQKTNWADTPVPGQLFETIEQSEIYKEYMASSEDTYDADRELWRKLYKTFIQENADLDNALEDQSLYWNDDKEIVDTFVLKTIKRFKEQNGVKQELLPEWDSDEEKEFARKLFRSAIAKLYSTSKSGGYINGMLDAIARNLIKSNRLMKHMEPVKGSKEAAEPKEAPAEFTAVPVKMRHRKRITQSDEGQKKD